MSLFAHTRSENPGVYWIRKNPNVIKVGCTIYGIWRYNQHRSMSPGDVMHFYPQETADEARETEKSIKELMEDFVPVPHSDECFYISEDEHKEFIWRFEAVAGSESNIIDETDLDGVCDDCGASFASTTLSLRSGRCARCHRAWARAEGLDEYDGEYIPPRARGRNREEEKSGENESKQEMCIAE